MPTDFTEQRKGKMDFDKKIGEITDFARENLSESRFSHSLWVAGTAAAFCANYNLNASRGFLAGIAHDICKEMSDERIWNLAAKDGTEADEIEREKISLLHGRAAAVLLKERFAIDDEEVLEAVAHHTFGKPDLSDLGLMIFVADKVEPTRERKNDLRALQKLPLRELARKIVLENIAYVKFKGKKMSNRTFDFLDWLEEVSKQ